jgi:RNA polymerase sigma-70 factor, ECF subfamily
MPFRPRPVPDLPSGDTAAAFDALVLAHYERLCLFAHRLVGSRATAEDIVQDLFLAIWRRYPEFNYSDPLPYLYRATYNRALSHGRNQRRKASWLARATRENAERATPPDDLAAQDEVAEAIEQAIAALPQRCRLIFTMHREQHLSYAEIADILRLSKKTIETQMLRALKSLRERLAPYLLLMVVLSSVLF